MSLVYESTSTPWTTTKEEKEHNISIEELRKRKPTDV